MTTIREQLQQIVQFQEAIENRGYQKLLAYDPYLEIEKTAFRFGFGYEKVWVYYSETKTFEPEQESVVLTIEELEKSHEEWLNYLQLIKEESEQKRKLKIENEEKANLESKKRQFEKLKKELGYDTE